MENSFVLLGSFSKQARRAGWSKEAIKAVLDKATSGDRENLEAVLFEALHEIRKPIGDEDYKSE